MDEQKVKAYLTKLSEDQEFQTKMQNAKTPEEALAVVKSYGFEFEEEEFKSLMMRLMVSIKQSRGEELTDEELDAVAGGGMSAGEVGGTIVFVTGGVVLASAI